MSTLLPQTVAASIESFMAAVLVVGTLSGAVVAVALRLLAAGSPRSRYLAAVAGIAVSMVVPAVIAVPQALPYAGSSPIQMAAAVGSAPETTLTTGAGGYQGPGGIGLPGRLTELEAVPWLISVAKTLRTAFDLAAPLWLAGALVMVVRLGGGLVALRRLRSTTSLAPRHLQLIATRISGDLGLSAPVPVRLGRGVPAPLVLGWGRPSVLLPESALTDLDDDQLEMVLAHEIAHVRGRDHQVGVALAVAAAFLWFQPVAWWLSRVARTEREFSCDDAALRRTGSEPVRYLRALATLAGSPRNSAAPALSGGVLLSRFEKLRLSREERPRFGHHGRGRAAALAASLLLTAAVAWAQVVPDEEPARPSASEVLAIGGFERIAWITSFGAFEFSADDRWIHNVAYGARVIIEELRQPDHRRGVVITGGIGGSADYRFTGELAESGDVSGREWLRRMLSDDAVAEIIGEKQRPQEQLGLQASARSLADEYHVSFIQLPVTPEAGQAEAERRFEFMNRSWRSSLGSEFSMSRSSYLESAHLFTAQLYSAGVIDEVAYEAQMSRLAEMRADLDEMRPEDPEDGGG